MIKWIYNIFLGLVALMVIILLLSRFQLTDAFRIMIVQSGSMEPEIKTGSLVLVMPSDNYRIGDIITFQSGATNQTPTTHRIVEIKNDNGEMAYTTKGDANNSADSNALKSDAIIGKIRLDIPYAGYIIDFIKQPIGFILVVLIPALVLIIDESRKIWLQTKEIKAKRKINKDVKENN